MMSSQSRPRWLDVAPKLTTECKIKPLDDPSSHGGNAGRAAGELMICRSRQGLQMAWKRTKSATLLRRVETSRSRSDGMSAQRLAGGVEFEADMPAGAVGFGRR